jgi:hypothetical protein
MSANGSGGSSDLEIRAPSELLVGVPATLTTQWRHSPQELVSGSVSYVANVSSLQRVPAVGRVLAAECENSRSSSYRISFIII